MAEIKLYDYQLDSIEKLRNGSILCGGVGSGKSRTSLAYYFCLCGGQLSPFKQMIKPIDLYIITTARKRDTKEWEGELIPFLLPCEGMTVKIDSWNNIKKYINVQNSFFIFDEQRVVGYGEWSKSFIKISRSNKWILLSATPGDTWSDYIPVFIANGYFKNKSEFEKEHVIFSRFAKYPKVDRYIGINKLIRLRNNLLVDMEFNRLTESVNTTIHCDYDSVLYKDVMKNRWDYEKNKPIENISELCYGLRKIVNSDPSRVESIIDILQHTKKVIIFYNFDYELDILKSIHLDDVEISEWNGHKHQPIPESDRWIYLVQYTAGAEGWNCIKTDTIIFYSQNYSYKIMVQASGRIDRLNTPYKKLYYYHLRSNAPIDIAISSAIKSKKKFNENRFFKM